MTTGYGRRLDAVEATLGNSTLPNRVVEFTFDDCDDREAEGESKDELHERAMRAVGRLF